MDMMECALDIQNAFELTRSTKVYQKFMKNGLWLYRVFKVKLLNFRLSGYSLEWIIMKKKKTTTLYTKTGGTIKRTH